jgi:hypothetical protein
MASDKTVVVEEIWARLQAEGSNRRVVHFDDVTEAIKECNRRDGKKRSIKNPANFMKDLIRKDDASKNWPASLTAIRIGGRQRVGSDRVFEFVDFLPGQQEAFPNLYFPKPGIALDELQSLSLPLASKALGRKDESWLIQVSVSLALLEQHMAIRSSLPVREIVHLQTGVKLANSEIDGLFRAILEDAEGNVEHVLLTCEAKQKGERILDHQIIEQVVAVTKSVKASISDEEMPVRLIVPMAVKAIGDTGEVYVAEFEPWTLDEALVHEDQLKQLKLASEGLYRLKPPVPGIGFNRPKPKKPRKSRKQES